MPNWQLHLNRVMHFAYRLLRVPYAVGTEEHVPQREWQGRGEAMDSHGRHSWFQLLEPSLTSSDKFH